MPYNANKHEQDILDFWKKDNTFEKSVNERPENKPYVFYDGPPFATGLPHYGHIVASVMKDVVPRYWTMKGYRVERVWGWDCHGLPIENIVEKELGTKSKKEIEEMGVATFNELCRSKVLSYVTEWEKTIHRLGRWVDMEHAYRTMDIGFMESVWWVFKELWDKDLIYKGYRAMHICPRCETTLSQQEVSEGYKDIKDISVTAQFKVVEQGGKDLQKQGIFEGVVGDVYMLAWTTTPWTLPGNVLLAVGDDIEYTFVVLDGNTYIVAKDLLMANFEGKEFEVIQNVKGKDLVGVQYEPLFPYFADSDNAFRVVVADFVTTDEGTGIVHIAPAFGTDDYEVFKRENVPFIQHVTMDGRFTDAVTDFAGMQVKPADDHMATDVEIVKWLAHNGKLFSKQKYEHSYPHCWRCDTPLLNYATTSWFVRVTDIKEKALKEAEHIEWSPEHIKEGRFGKWLGGARDWSISRQRFWASVMPVWECENKTQNSDNKTQGCEYVVVGSVAELEKLSGQKVDDLHKHVVDKITFPCPNCGKIMTRIPDVLDTWFDSGSMPYAQVHYPFENTETFEKGFPAEFIAEGQDQTRAWFYYLHMLATALKGTPAYTHVIVNGIVLAEDGKKMSKKLQNYPDPNKILEQYGADALRYYLMSSPVVAAENLNFAEEGVREVFNKVVNTLYNVLEFYEMFDGEKEEGIRNNGQNSEHVLDKWILAKVQVLVQDVTSAMDAYKLNEAARPIMDFILELSQWYVRRSRDRFKGDDVADAAAAMQTLGHVLEILSKLMAPFTPFIAEKVWYGVTGSKESVHLQEWPVVDEKLIDQDIVNAMQFVRNFATMAHMQRKKEGIPVRQPLALLSIGHSADAWPYWEETKNILADEINVKEVTLDSSLISVDPPIRLETTITPELKREGILRELVRAINGMRKQQGLTRHDTILVSYQTESDVIRSAIEEFMEDLKQSVIAEQIVSGEAEEYIDIDAEKIGLKIAKKG
ncbi:MAG: isoleucine--tRNA ligase [Candidatus Magasanikbacteria bacterium CG10_big_fil_rev_8_21_14_0_10_47_10]|uniref:Isoleucine--tRNA ligase n=1 Tax=Candidatus Magasanikbacteria bacterium CG10_big_fil_rev_8_21_14_0_10_47_10 TaxID=1974652 RepID=A0A2H0TRN6_9BACT|nr:MAG: isoleucine--tRNA ligase [Candidatus Magasanikbacteria bacterium CG10_big_fil_rev_8_21_14_0_10_47_10]